VDEVIRNNSISIIVSDRQHVINLNQIYSLQLSYPRRKKILVIM